MKNNNKKMQQENFFGQYFDKYFTCERQEKKKIENLPRKLTNIY